MKALLAAIVLCAVSLPVHAEMKDFIRFSNDGTSGFDYQSQVELAGDGQGKVVAAHLLLAQFSSAAPDYAGFTGSQPVARNDIWQPQTGTSPVLNEAFIHLVGDGQGKVVAPDGLLAQFLAAPDYAGFTGSQPVARNDIKQRQTGTSPALNEAFIQLVGDGQGKVVAPSILPAQFSVAPDYVQPASSQWFVPTSLTVQDW
jgi:hypothetical protein